MTEEQPAAAPMQCRTCGEAIIETEVGWTHVDSRGVLLSWTCSMPHMGIAEPDELAGPGDSEAGGRRRRPAPIPPTSRHGTVEQPTHYPGP